MNAPVEITEITSSESKWEGRGWFPPGPQLALCLAGEKRLSDLSDAELIEVMAAARRQTAWAQARELAAIAELSARREIEDQRDEDTDHRVLTASESLIEEISTALTVTGNTAALLMHTAQRLANALPGTRAALERGQIDLPKARVICDATDGLPDHAAAILEAAVLARASEQTTGQLRRRSKTLAQRLAPESFEERVKQSVRDRRVELWENTTGTASLALLDIAADDAHAIHNKMTAAARSIRAEGDNRTLDQIRADLATQLLRGHPLPTAIATLLTQPPPPPDAEPETSPAPPLGDVAFERQDHPSTSLPQADARQAHATPTSQATEPAHPSTRPHRRGHTTAASPRDTSRLITLPRPHTLSTSVHVEQPQEPGAADDGRSGSPPDLPALVHPPAPGRGAAPRPGRIPWSDVAGVSPEVRHCAYGREPSRRLLHRHGEWLGRGEEESGAEVREVAPWWSPDGVNDGRALSALAGDVERRLVDVRARLRGAGRLDELADLVAGVVRDVHRALTPFRDAFCATDEQGRHGHPGYRPPAALRRMVEARHSACVFPTCNRRVEHCDLDHTVAFDAHGPTCGCNLAPLCRRHHRTKQSPGWRLFQPWPGLLVWVTPSGTWHIVQPE